MAGVDVDVSQLHDLSADLGKAGVQVVRKTPGVLEKVGKQVADLAKQNAPHRTGALAGSIGVDRLSLTSVQVGASRYYGYFQEYGTHKMASHPFIGPAADAAEPIFAKAMEDLGGNIL